MSVAVSVRFAAAVQAVCAEARRQGLVAPGFRSPPRPPNAIRTISRRAGGQAVVAVRVRGRRFHAVAADIVEGVLVANRVTGNRATALRTTLLAAVAEADEILAA